jgi:hypothetical protein
MSPSLRFIVVTVVMVSVSTFAWAQNRVRVINSSTPILASDRVTPLTNVDAGAELIVISEQGNWIEVLLPGLNPRRETGFIARANIGPVRSVPAGQAPATGRPAEPPAAPQPAPRAEGQRPTAPSVPRQVSTSRVALLGTGLRGFATIGAESFLAQKSIDAVLGSAPIPGHLRGPWLGGGAQFQSRRGLFVEGEVGFFRRAGERVVVTDDTVFRLGIPDTLTLVPVTASVGYRFRTRSIGPFVGAGFGQYLFSEKTPFDDADERAWNKATSGHVFGGVEFRAARGLGIAAQARYSRVPGALTGGLATIFNETDLGGFQASAKVLIGR